MENKFTVINIDKNGNVIPDLSKVVLPDDLQRKVIMIKRRDDYKQKENDHDNDNQKSF